MIPPFFARILPTLKKKLEINMFFAKIIFHQLHDNQLKHLQAIEKEKQRCNVLKKYIMQLCKWNAMRKSELKCV
jgi:hypothetical protein